MVTSRIFNLRAAFFFLLASIFLSGTSSAGAEKNDTRKRKAPEQDEQSFDLHALPPEVLTIVADHLDGEDFVRLTSTCRKMRNLRAVSGLFVPQQENQFFAFVSTNTDARIRQIASRQNPKIFVELIYRYFGNVIARATTVDDLFSSWARSCQLLNIPFCLSNAWNRTAFIYYTNQAFCAMKAIAARLRDNTQFLSVVNQFVRHEYQPDVHPGLLLNAWLVFVNLAQQVIGNDAADMDLSDIIQAKTDLFLQHLDQFRLDQEDADTLNRLRLYGEQAAYFESDTADTLRRAYADELHNPERARLWRNFGFLQTPQQVLGLLSFGTSLPFLL